MGLEKKPKITLWPGDTVRLGNKHYKVTLPSKDSFVGEEIVLKEKTLNFGFGETKHSTLETTGKTFTLPNSKVDSIDPIKQFYLVRTEDSLAPFTDLECAKEFAYKNRAMIYRVEFAGAVKQKYELAGSPGLNEPYCGPQECDDDDNLDMFGDDPY
jgi:hypothetical protein